MENSSFYKIQIHIGILKLTKYILDLMVRGKIRAIQLTKNYISYVIKSFTLFNKVIQSERYIKPDDG